MAETSTPLKDSLCTENFQDNGLENNGLSEEDQRFYSFLSDGLEKLSKSPRNSAIDNILNYSKSL